MRATILVAGLFLVASSAFAANGASQETQVVQGSLIGGYSSDGLPQYTVNGASVETQVPQGSLEGFGATGLPQ